MSKRQAVYGAVAVSVAVLMAAGDFSRFWLYRLTPAKPVWFFDEVKDADLILLSGTPLYQTLAL